MNVVRVLRLANGQTDLNKRQRFWIELPSASEQQECIGVITSDLNRAVPWRIALNDHSCEDRVLAASQSESLQKTGMDSQWHFNGSFHGSVILHRGEKNQ